MSASQTITAKSGRQFATFPAAVVAFVINDAEQFLFLRQTKEDSWEPSSGALEAGESPTQGVARELAEELGSAFRHRILGPVHVGAFKFDENVTNMLSFIFVVHYLGGEIVPGDDMLGAEFRWIAVEEFSTLRRFTVPWDISLFSESLDLFRLWKKQKKEDPTN